jgi:HK97 family phage prohead protease
MATEIERRSFSGKIELRAPKRGSKSPGTLVGYAARFDSLSEDLGGFVETIAPGAFSRALKGSDVRALRNHQPDTLLGRTSTGTLVLEEDSQGLRMEIELPDTSAGRDTKELIQRGDLSGASFSFSNTSDEWDFKANPPLRTLRSMDLHDVGPVTFPAYAETSVAIRSLNQNQATKVVDPLIRWKNRLRMMQSF